MIHIASWRARAEHNGLQPAELAATVPAEVCKKLGLSPETLLTEMPPLAELSEGLESMLG